MGVHCERAWYVQEGKLFSCNLGLPNPVGTRVSAAEGKVHFFRGQVALSCWMFNALLISVPGKNFAFACPRSDENRNVFGVEGTQAWYSPRGGLIMCNDSVVLDGYNARDFVFPYLIAAPTNSSNALTLFYCDGARCVENHRRVPVSKSSVLRREEYGVFLYDMTRQPAWTEGLLLDDDIFIEAQLDFEKQRSKR